MRKINTKSFALATRRTQRDVNSRIVLNLIREFQPISRAELARRMKVRRGVLTTLVRELLESGTVEETQAETVIRGRRPTMLSVSTSGRLVVAADIRPGHTFLALADASGRLVARSEIATPESPERFGELLASAMESLVQRHTGKPGVARACVGAGIVCPGMIDRKTGKLLYSPLLGWRDVDLRNAVAKRLGVKTYIESAPIACALAQLWLAPEETRSVSGFAYVHISDGLGVGIVLNGEAIRGDTHSAGEFGHITLDPEGPVCSCGRRGCWEALARNTTSVARYGKAVEMPELVRRGLMGEPGAAAALVETGRYIGRGLALVIAAFNPGRVYIGGEISEAWSIIEAPIRAAVTEAGITRAAQSTPIVPDRNPAEHRLQGAVALVNAPTFAALAVG